MPLIKRENARITWNLYEKTKFLSEFVVFDTELFGYNPPKLKYTAGNCYKIWKDLSHDLVISSCLDLLICNNAAYQGIHFIRECYKELGKIEELECIRKILYEFYADGMTYEEFMERFYG